MAPEEKDKWLVEKFGESVMKETEEYRERLYSWCMAVTYLSEVGSNIEFNQPSSQTP